jgi:hypothetical protein
MDFTSSTGPRTACGSPVEEAAARLGIRDLAGHLREKLHNPDWTTHQRQNG